MRSRPCRGTGDWPGHAALSGLLLSTRPCARGLRGGRQAGAGSRGPRPRRLAAGPVLTAARGWLSEWLRGVHHPPGACALPAWVLGGGVVLSKTLRVMKFFLDSDYNHGVFLFCFVLLLHVIVLVLVLVIVKLTDV